ncbi:hypothetical protein BP6252_08783 [Coleophoma cylindrospora]|uniref:Rhodopsin domain-containing protein n=1 Tax=Coleophoma cylindrospora TaxID=1849047 RepID=A0A3D8R6U7_9HELO|nr:hypothetical protein BP6252_08783 [Coleophoma cylindrospora]
MVDNRGPTIAGAAYAMAALSTVATLLRIYCRAWVSKAFGADDWLAVIAQGLYILYCSYSIRGVGYGTGKHLTDIPTDKFIQAMQMWWSCEPLYVLTSMAIKASIAIFLLRVCVKTAHKVIIWTVLVTTEIYSFFFFLLFVLQCLPTSLFWNRYKETPPEGKCIRGIIVYNSFYGYSAISCAADWTFSILPIFMVWGLQMDLRIKLFVVAILAAGALASTATIIRFPELHHLNDIGDFLYTTSGVAIWSTVEMGIGITAAAAATLRPLLRKFFGIGTAAGLGSAQSGSAPQWPKPASASYVRNRGSDNLDEFDLDAPTKKTGEATVVDYGDGRRDLERALYRQDNRSGTTVSIRTSLGSQAEFAKRPAKQSGGASWDVTVSKTVEQTRR